VCAISAAGGIIMAAGASIAPVGALRPGSGTRPAMASAYTKLVRLESGQGFPDRTGPFLFFLLI
jgi:hypothetical protein